MYPTKNDLPEAARANLEALGAALAAFAAATRKSIDLATELRDASTSDLFTEVSRDADKHLWPVESHFQAAR